MPNSKALMRNIGFWRAGEHGGDVVVTTQGAEAEQSTDFVERPDAAESVAVWVYGDFAIAAGELLTIIGNLRDAATGGAAPADLPADLGPPLGVPDPIQVADGDVATAGQFLQRLGNYQLHGARQEIQTQYILAYSGGGGEVTSVVVFLVFAGTETGPAPQTTPNH